MKRILAIALGLLACTSLLAQEQDLDLQYATELLKPGTPAPDFTLTDINGNAVSLRDLQGRKVVLVFWASWCPDCRAEVPDLKYMQTQADPRKVAFVAVSFDRTQEAWEKYVKENEMTGIQLFETAPRKESFVNNAYHVKWIPSIYLIDEQGKVVLSTVVLDKVSKALDIKLEK
jgi:peroxiredoxin